MRPHFSAPKRLPRLGFFSAQGTGLRWSHLKEANSRDAKLVCTFRTLGLDTDRIMSSL
jgi:hypothetical protein